MKQIHIRHLINRAAFWSLSLLMTSFTFPACSEDISEYQLKAAFLYNFASFTEWPDELNGTLRLCVYGTDPFGTHLDKLENRAIGHRHLSVQRITQLNQLNHCQIVFISRSASNRLMQVVNKVSKTPVLTVSDIPDAIQQGVAINMTTQQNRVTFDANLNTIQQNGLHLSSKLLRLATEVVQ